jgi:hypothetical protein
MSPHSNTTSAESQGSAKSGIDLDAAAGGGVDVPGRSRAGTPGGGVTVTCTVPIRMGRRRDVPRLSCASRSTDSSVITSDPSDAAGGAADALPMTLTDDPTSTATSRMTRLT